MNTFLLYLTFTLVGIMFCGPPLFVAWLYYKTRTQKQHSLLRGHYWYIGILRYIIESVGPEFRFYITDEDNSGQPISRVKFTSVVKASKYLKTLISFGSKRDFSRPGIYMKNSLFPRIESELKVDNSMLLATRKYVTDHESLFFRHEHVEELEVRPWRLTEEEQVIIGPEREHPFHLKGLVGMSGMSYGALGRNAITTLSKGIGMAGGSWMNTGEGGLSNYHLSGGCDIIFQIGPGMFGVRDGEGKIDWALVRKKAAISEVKAIELKLGQGAKIRGGHVEGVKVTPEIAAIRGVPAWKNIDSPGRFEFCPDEKTLFDFITRIQDETGLPVGVKVVISDNHALDKFLEEYVKRGRGPDFITVDGGEGGTGATFKEMADVLGLPAFSSIIIADDSLRRAGVRDKVRLIASGKIHLPDEVGIALSLGADLVNIARGFMIATGCIMAHKCHSNECPVGVATTDRARERALFVDEKKYRVMNYIITLRAGLFHLAGACGLTSPAQFTREHITFKDWTYRASDGLELFPYPDGDKDVRKLDTGNL